MNIISVWSEVLRNSNNLKENIKNIDIKQENLDDLIKYSEAYFDNAKNFKRLISDKNHSTTYRIYNAYLEANIGIVGNELMNLKEKNIDAYNILINSIEDIDIKELVYYKEKLIEDYTPYDIHVLSGKEDEEYNGWY
ncbi:hypothetical protein [Tepidibacter hydrothermalis]|uniref:Uncharacterized protein n=1 Tax=Tepidibacter hydrothermalis TaxID=3036126 RepID=A0ABY8ECR1_9FIRM|nr:hypothetical protein [Tepidibacter hydrothermalis]WFD09282.1 hypothetical protein P4S50_12905 [Tepidibacter hydrothermalis]